MIRLVSRTAPAEGGRARCGVRDQEAAGQARNGLTYEALVAVAKARTTILQTAIGIR